ncbi:MAG TPA: hypothetical protein VGI75_00590, partial [Pirellulales bacterium]
SVSPESLLLGDVTTGTQVSKKVLVRGKQAFKIVSMKCDADCFNCKTDDQSSERHIVDVVFNAKQDPGKVKETIHISTDLGAGLQTDLTAYATVVPAATEPKKESNVTSSSTGTEQGAISASDPPQVVSQ